MALPAVLEDSLSGQKAGVNADRESLVALNQNEDKAGVVILAVRMGKTTDPSGGYVENLRASDTGRLLTGSDQTMFNEMFPGTAINTGLWQQSLSSMTLTLANGFANLNAGSALTLNAAALLRTYRHFPTLKSYPTAVDFDFQFSSLPVVGNVSEFGSFIATGVATPTDGVFFRLTAAGELRAVVNANGVESQSAALSFATLIGAGTTRRAAITIGDNEVDFYIDGVHVAGVERPASAAAMTGSMNLPLSFRTYNSAATATAQILRVGPCNVTLGDINSGKSWQHQVAGSGGNASQGQTGGVIGQTAVYANSALPAAAVPANISAALGTGLGGLFVETDTLAVGTDGIIMSYQVPLGTAAAPGRSLYITRLRIDTMVHTALVGGGYASLWGLAYGHTAVSLATAEAVNAKAPRRIPLGQGAVAAGAAIATQVGTGIDIHFEVPIYVAPGEFIQLIRRKSLGTAPTGGALLHCITPNGYWE